MSDAAWAFFGEHWFISLCALFVAASVIKRAIEVPYYAINRVLRHLNIRRHGWPPAHVDADGDFRPRQEQSS